MERLHVCGIFEIFFLHPSYSKLDSTSVLKNFIVLRRNYVGGVFVQFYRQVKPHVHTRHERAASQRQE